MSSLSESEEMAAAYRAAANIIGHKRAFVLLAQADGEGLHALTNMADAAVVWGFLHEALEIMSAREPVCSEIEIPQ